MKARAPGMSVRTVFDSEGSHVPSKCVRCGIVLGNYSLWHRGEGPLCYLYKARLEVEE